MICHSLLTMSLLLLLSSLVPTIIGQEWGPHNGRYVLVDDYNPTNFFDLFDFDTVGFFCPFDVLLLIWSEARWQYQPRFRRVWNVPPI